MSDGIQKQKGLRGIPSIVEQRKRNEFGELRKWEDLSEEDQENFLQRFPKLRGKSQKQISATYDNRNYIDTFGMSAFQANPDKSSRDAEYRDYALRDIARRVYADEPADVKNAINTLSIQGVEELLNSNYVTEKEKKELSPWLDKYEKLNSTVAGKALFELAKLGSSQTALKAKQAKIEAEGYEQNNKDILSKISADDDRRKTENATGLTRAYNEKLTQLGSDFVEEAWNTLANGSKEETGYGDTVEEDGIGLYKMFEGRHELRDFGYAEKKKLLSQYYALLDIYKNPAIAKQALTTQLQDYIHRGQNAWDWWSSAISGIGTKASADIMQTYLGVAALAGDAMYGDDWLAQYLQGKDENGNERALLNNVRYWNGVDMYNTFSNDLIGKIEDNGGISPYNWLSEAGNERNTIAALNEGVKMTGYMLAQMALARGIGKGMGKIAGKAGGVFRDGQLVVEASSPRAMRIMQTYAPLTTSAVNAISISTGYAKGSFDKVLQESREKINLYKEAEAAEYVNSILGDSSGIKWTEHGYEGSSEVHGSNNHAAEMNAWIANRVNEMLDSGVPENEIDITQLAKEALYNYKEHKRQEYIDNLNSSIFWKRADQRALEEAASAYERNATIEFLRMSGVNYLFKGWMNDKSVRRAQAANYPGLIAGRGAGEAEQIAAKASFLGREVNPKIARYYGAMKALYGGWESNYFDDVWANYSQAFSKGSFNNFMAYNLDGNKAAYASDWAAGFLSGIRGFEEALVDPQSWYDGLIGALGTIEGGMFRFNTMFRNPTMNRYDENQISKYASLSGMHAEEYVRGDYSVLKEKIKRTQPKLSDEQVDEMVDKIKDAYNFKKMVQEGNIEELSFIEKANNYFGNALMQEYADATSREREFKGIIDAGNKEIANKKDAIDDIIHAINAVSLRKIEEYGNAIVDMKEAKAFEGFELARLLQKWSVNPLLARSEFVQTSQQKLRDIANGNITQEDIDAFLANADNKSEVGTGNEVEFAKERLQSNAKQLIEIQNQYNKALEEVKESKGYQAIGEMDSFEDLLTELVFNRVMKSQREKRIGQMNSEIEGTETPGVISDGDYIARFGSEKGYEAHIKTLDEQIANAEKQVSDANDAIKDAKRIKRSEGRKVAVEASQLAYEDAVSSLSELKAKKSSYIQLHEAGMDFSRVLSKEEIKHLSPEERATILNPNNLHNYSKEQQAVIKELDAEMKMQDPDYYEKVRDIAELVNRNNDLVHVNWLMESNMPAALGYFNYARQIRQQQALRALQLQQFDRATEKLENAETPEDRVAIAKTTGHKFLSDYIDKHPEHKEELTGALNLLKLKGDFSAATVTAIPKISENLKNSGMSDADVQQAIPVVQRTLQMFVHSFNNILKSPDIKTEEDMMGALEEWRDGMTDGAGYFDVVMNELTQLNHQRNATKIQEIADRKAAEEFRRKQAEEAVGKNFGFDGYVKGDVVYNRDGRVGTIVRFRRNADNSTVMEVAWTTSGNNEVFGYGTDAIANGTISKNQPAENPATNTSPTNSAPAQSAPQVDEKVFSEGIPEDALFDFTQDGEIISRSDDEEVAIASRRTKGSSFVIDIDRGVLPLEEVYHAGLMVGNAIYEYDIPSLNGPRVQKRRIPGKPNDTMSAFFNWLDSNNIKLQEIIDNELNKIFKANPKVPVKFMIVNEPGMELHIVEVLDYDGVVRSVHNDEARRKWGGVVEAGGKEYLVIGTLGYDRNNSAPFFRIANQVRDGARRDNAFAGGNTRYVYQGAHTQIARIGRGSIFKQGINESKQQYRTLSEMFADPDRNPNKINFSNAILGIMYGTKYFITNRTPTDGILVPPGRSDSTLGRVFLMVKATNGNYSPVALRDKITLNDLKDTEYKQRILDTVRSLGSSDFTVRREALTELKNRLVLDSVSNIRIGNPSDNRVTIIRNGAPVWTRTITPNFNYEELEREVLNTQFKINITQGIIENETELRLLDEAGGLQTDVSALRTTNASVDVFEVDGKGEPIIIPVGKPDIDTRKENESRKGEATIINGTKYRIVDGNYVDDFNQDVKDPDLRYSIFWKIQIQKEGLIPAFVSDRGYKYYITDSDRNDPRAIMVDRAGNVTSLPSDRALGLIDYAAKMAAEEAARLAAEEEAERLMEIARLQREGLEGFIDPRDVIMPQEPAQRLPIAPAQKPQPPVAPQEERKPGFKEDPNKATDKTLTDLQADKKVSTFVSVYMRRQAEFEAIATDKGWNWGITLRQKQAFLKDKLGQSFNPDIITNEEELIDLIKNCR